MQCMAGTLLVTCSDIMELISLICSEWPWWQM